MHTHIYSLLYIYIVQMKENGIKSSNLEHSKKIHVSKFPINNVKKK